MPTCKVALLASEAGTKCGGTDGAASIDRPHLQIK